VHAEATPSGEQAIFDEVIAQGKPVQPKNQKKHVAQQRQASERSEPTPKGTHKDKKAAIGHRSGGLWGRDATVAASNSGARQEATYRVEATGFSDSLRDSAAMAHGNDPRLSENTRGKTTAGSFLDDADERATQTPGIEAERPSCSACDDEPANPRPGAFRLVPGGPPHASSIQGGLDADESSA
jgi:hypothetical protein